MVEGEACADAEVVFAAICEGRAFFLWDTGAGFGGGAAPAVGVEEGGAGRTGRVEGAWEVCEE